MKNHHRISAILAAIGTVAAFQVQAQAGGVSEEGSEFLQTAAKGGYEELHVAQLAQTRATNESVREFAQTLIDDHATLNERLRTLATKKGVQLPVAAPSTSTTMTTGTTTTSTSAAKQSMTSEEVDEDVQDKLDDLGSKEGAEFDRAFIDSMIEDHENDIEEFEEAAQNMDDPEVAQFAQEHLPTLREHLQRAQAIKQALG